MEAATAVLAGLSLVSAADLATSARRTLERTAQEGRLDDAGKVTLAQMYIDAEGGVGDLHKARSILDGLCFPSGFYRNPAIPATAKYQLADLYYRGRAGPQFALRARVICTHLLAVSSDQSSEGELFIIDKAAALCKKISINVEPAYKDYRRALILEQEGNYIDAGTILERDIFTNLQHAYQSPETMVRATFLKAHMLAHGHGYERDSHRAALLLQEVVDYAAKIDLDVYTDATNLLADLQQEEASP